MAIEPPSFEHISTAINHAIAPAFILGAVASFLSILISRLERVEDMRRAALAAQPIDAELAAILDRRVRLLHGAIYFAVLSALATAGLLILSFAIAMMGLPHQIGMAFAFIVALALMMASLAQLTRDVRLAMPDMPRRQKPPR